MKRALVAFWGAAWLCIATAPSLALPANGNWKSFVGKLSQDRAWVFVSVCNMGRPDHIAVVVFPLGKSEGRFFWLETHGGAVRSTLNFGSIKLDSRGAVDVDVALGDKTDRFMVGKIIQASLGVPMKLTIFDTSGPDFNLAPICPPTT